MKLNESDIKKIIREVISEGSFINLKRRGGFKITEIDILSSIIEEISTVLEDRGYELDTFYGINQPIPEYLKPYLDEITDIMSSLNFDQIIWDAVISQIADSELVYRIINKIDNDLENN